MAEPRNWYGDNGENPRWIKDLAKSGAAPGSALGNRNYFLNRPNEGQSGSDGDIVKPTD